MNHKRWIGGGLMAASLSGFTNVALASSEYPGVLQETLALAAAPDCTLCHVGSEGPGTVNTPFGKSARARGLVAGNPEKLKAVLAAMATDNVDSDHDGIPDIQELKMNTDPNTPNGADAGPIEPVSYGCRLAEPAPAGEARRGPVALALLGLAAALLRQRRRH